MEHKNAKKLVKKYLKGTCTPEERATIESWYEKEAVEKKDPAGNDPDYFRLEKDIWSELQQINTSAQKSLRKWLTAAAALLLITSSIWYLKGNLEPIDATMPLSQNKIVPGANKAVLVLGDGSRIDLSEAKRGELTKQPGVNIKKIDDGQLIYDFLAAKPSPSGRIYNTVITPRGGQFQVNLPDGTRVWLNASSSIKFPTVFDPADRIVEISGEAYFEVFNDNKRPFKVKSASQVVEVLGTHFNVNAYPEEESIKTTLLEGSVKVTYYDGSPTKKLIPGQQSIYQNGVVKVTMVDEEDAIAWKNGYFQFNSEDISVIMRKIARWYDVEIVYHKDFVHQRFAGAISKYEDISKVLRMLELTGSIHFKIDERRITVMP